MNLSTIVWKEISDDNFELRDAGGNRFQADIDQITNYADRTTLFADLDTWRQDCSLVPTGGGGPIPTDGTGTYKRSDEIGPGSTTANILGWSITNIGNANGTLDGAILAPGQNEFLNAELDPVTGIYKRLPSVSFDATGTAFTLSEYNV